MSITQEELKSKLNYNCETGLFTWKQSSSNRIKIGGIAGNTWFNKHNGKIYKRIFVKDKLYYSHRLAWFYVYGAWPEQEIDHVNGNGEDNRLINLRCVSSSENKKNMKIKSSNNSGVSGISFHKKANKWMCRITVNKKTIYIGLFEDINDATLAIKKYREIYGFHKNHGSDRPL